MVGPARRGFTMVEVVAVLALSFILATVSTIAYRALQSSESDNRATVSLMAAAMAQRSVAASTGGFVTSAESLKSITGGANIVNGQTVSTSDDQVSMFVNGDGVWLVAQGTSCRYLYIAPVDEQMTTSAGQLIEGTCLADNESLPGRT